MSKDWTAAELKAASDVMKRMGFMSYEEFEAALQKYVANKVHSGIDREELERRKNDPVIRREIIAILNGEDDSEDNVEEVEAK